MKRKILTMITIGSIFLYALTGCGDSSGNRTTSGKATTEESETKTENPVVREAGLYQSDGSFIPWDDLGIDVETDYMHNYKTEDKSPYRVFRDNEYAGELVFPDNIAKIGVYAFFDCTSLTGIDLRNTQLTDIEYSAFDHCTSLASIDFPDTLTSIGNHAFWSCESLTSIDFPDALTSIGAEAFAHCTSLTSIDLSNTQLTDLKYTTFGYCTSLASIDLPDTLTSIGEEFVFIGCTALTSIDLPDTLEVIGYGAFAGCTSLTDINYAGTREEWNDIEKHAGADIDKLPDWNQNSAIETITCSDGVITP